MATSYCVFLNDTATNDIYTLSLHDALPILHAEADAEVRHLALARELGGEDLAFRATLAEAARHQDARSEEHTSELQSRRDLVCRLLLEKKKDNSLYRSCNLLDSSFLPCMLV